MSSRKKKKASFSGSHQRSWLWGHHAVCETLQSGIWPVLEIFVSAEAFAQSSQLLQAKQGEGIPLEIVDYSRLEQLTHSTEHQGLAARLGEFPYCSMVDLEKKLTRIAEELATPPTISGVAANRPSVVVICDRIQDAFNFGAILRCCDGANVVGVIVGDRNQAEVTPHVARSSSGAVNHIPIIRQHDLVRSVLRLKELGMQLVAADANARTSLWDSQLSGPIALLVGSEAHGISPELLAQADQHVIIPMMGHVTSLNVAVATGIILYEIRRQQNPKS
jgi:23S rRNA (guanosine2251-2'-O)-methyltransferase